jgi:hypothetical protein
MTKGEDDVLHEQCMKDSLALPPLVKNTMAKMSRAITTIKNIAMIVA